MTRLIAWCLTGIGFLALGADALHFAESAGRSPYTLAWAATHGAWQETMPVLAAVTRAGTLVGELPVSLVLLWLGAVLFLMAGSRAPVLQDGVTHGSA